MSGDGSEKKITAMIDNNERLWNQPFCVDDDIIPINSRKFF